MRRPLAHLLSAALVLPLFAACGDDGAAPAADTTADVGADIQDTAETPDSAGDSSGEDTTTEDAATEDTAPEDAAPEDTTPEDTTPADASPEDTTPEDTAPEDTTPEDVAVDTTEPPTAGYIPVANGSFESPVALPATTPAPDGWRYYTYFTNPAPASWVVGYAEDYGIEAPDGDQVLVVSSPSANAEFRYNDTPVDTNIQPGDLYIISAKVRMLNPGTTAYFAVGVAVSDRTENIVETELNPATVTASGYVIDRSDTFLQITTRMNVRRLQRGQNLYPFIFTNVTDPIVIDEIIVWRDTDTDFEEPPGGIVPNPAFDHMSLPFDFSAPGWLGWDTSACTRAGDARTTHRLVGTSDQPLPPTASPFGELRGCEVKTVAVGVSVAAGQNVKVTAHARGIVEGGLIGPGGNGGAGPIPLRFFVDVDGFPRLSSPEFGVANGSWQEIVWCFPAQIPATNPTIGLVGTAQVDDLRVEVGVPACP